MDMVRTSNGRWITGYAHIYEAKWTYPSSVALGNCAIIATVIDNNGFYHEKETGSYNPFIEEAT